MKSLGRDLKSIRESKAIALERIAEKTRISLRHLQSLEEGHYDRLPGGLYNRAILRAYCTNLGIEATGFLERFARESVPGAAPAPPDSGNAPVLPSRRFSWPPAILLCAGFALLALGLLWGRKWLDEVFVTYLARPPVVGMRDTDTEPDSGARVTMTRGPSRAEATMQADSQAAQAAGLPEEIGSKPVALQDSHGTIRLEFVVVESCWVSVHRDGENVLVRLLKPGEDLALAASDRFYLVLGNAGGVHLKINGQPARTLGKPGEVVRMLINEKNLSDLLEKSVG